MDCYTVKISLLIKINWNDIVLNENFTGFEVISNGTFSINLPRLQQFPINSDFS